MKEATRGQRGAETRGKIEAGISRRDAASPRPGVARSLAPDKPARQHALNIALIAIAVVALFWRVFFLGETLIDVATLSNQLPWGYAAEASDYPYNRRDLTDMYATRDYFVVAAYRDGELPLWNPYTMAGHPIYADGVTRIFSPALVFYKFFDVPLGYSLARITELILAAAFMYLFLVSVGVGPSGALTGTIVFTLSAHSMLHLTGLGWWGGLMWLPLILLFVDRAITRSSYGQAAIAGVFLAAQFFCGYMPNQIYYVGVVALYYLLFSWIKKSGVKKALMMMAVTLAVGLALSATQWVPTLELLRHSNRRIVGSELGYIYLPPWYSLTLVFPDLFGAAYDVTTLTLFTALGVSHDHILYLGVAALLPLGFSVYALRRGGVLTDRQEDPRGDASPRHRVKLLALLAAISLVVMMAAPLYVPVTRYIPVLQVIRVAVRAGVLFLFAASALVAFGTDLLLESSKATLAKLARFARRFVFGAVALVLIGVATSYAMRASGFAAETGERGRVAFIRRAALALSEQFLPPGGGLLVPLAVAATAALMLWLLSKDKISRRAFFAGLVALLLVDLSWAGGQFNETFERSRVYPRTQITDLLRRLPPGRVLVVPAALETNRRASSETRKIIAPPNTLLAYRLPTVAGKNQQFPRWYREFASLIEPQPNLSHVVFDRPGSPFFDLLGVRYVMTYDSAPQPEGRFNLIAAAEGVSVYENLLAMPRAFFAGRVIEASTPADSLDKMRDAMFDPHSDVVVETGDRGKLESGMSGQSLEARDATSDEARIVDDRRNRVVIETDRDAAGLLVLSDNYYPGWRALVDGEAAEILRANHTMRAVRVPAGRHVVSFQFAPATFWAAAYASLGAAVMLAGAFGFAAIRRGRKDSREGQGHDLRED